MSPPSELPSGTVTFLITDIAGSTRLWDEHPQAMARAVATHDELITSAVAEAAGHIVKSTGDGLHAVFSRAEDAVAAAIAAQISVTETTFPEIGVLRVRMALHTGETEERAGDYFGPPLNRVARLLELGHGGQILVSRATCEVVSDRTIGEARLLDLGQHRLRDLTRPEKVFQLTHGEMPSEFLPLRGLDSQPNNLPIQLTSFIGREDELIKLQKLLYESPLVTLVGVGGTGKTRLALQAAAETLASFPDGAWFIDLSPISEPELVAAEVGKPLGVQDTETATGRPLIDLLAQHLSTLRALVVLDNCEHVLEASRSLVEAVLGRCPGITIMATSREVLHTPGEAVYHVPPLGLPAKGEAGASESVRLFLARASRVRSGFEPSPADIASLEEITRRLDGLPLAIELAASRVNLLSPAQILDRLEDRFALLAARAGAGGRHAALTATMDWSYDHLTPTEKSLLRRLSVFSGGWTLEAAEAICVSATSSGQILDVLGSLVDKSLVEVTSTGPQNRYRLLETVRQYSQSHLQAEGEDETARQSHTHYFLRLAETSEAGLRGPDQAECVDRIEAEHDNIRTALSWTLDTGRRDEALKLVAAMGWFWFMRGYWKEALRWFSRAYLPAEGADPLLRAWAVCKTAAIEVYRAAPSKVADLVAEARETFDRSRDEFGFALATLLFAHVSAIDAPEEDERLCRSALRSFEELGAEWETAFTVGQLGGALAWSDNEDEGLALIRQGIEGLLALGDRWCASWIAFNLGATLAAKGRIEESRGVLEQAIDLAAGTGDRWAGPHTKGRLAIVSTMEGRPEEAKKLFAEALSLHDRIGDENCSSLCRMYLADVHLAEGDFEEAARRAREALIGYQSTENPAAVLSCVRRFGFISLEEGQHDRAATLLSATEAIRGDRPLTAFDQERLTAASDRLRGALGEVEYERHTAAGANLELEETVSLALER